MKRLLILFLIALLSVSAFAQDLPAEFDINDYIDEGAGEDGKDVLDTEGLIEALNNPNVEVEPTELLPLLLNEDIADDIPIAEFLPEPENEGDPVLSVEDLEELKTSLEESGEFDTSVIDSAVEAVDKIANEGATIGDIRDDPNIDFEAVEEAFIVAASDMVAGELIDEETRAELESGLGMVGSALNILNGFGQATANTAVTNSLFGYQDYKLFVFSVGTLGSISIPEPLKTFNNIQTMNFDQDTELIIDEFAEMGVDVGVAFQGLTASFGINLSWLIDDFYVTAIFGSTLAEVSTTDGIYAEVLTQPQEIPAELPEDLPFTIDMSTGSSVYGLKANFQLVNGFGIPILFRWNGLSVGTGYINTTTHAEASLDVSSLMNLQEDSLGIEFSIDSMVHTIPLEISTGIQVLSLATVTAGAGVDLQFGTSETYFGLPPNDSIGAKLIEGVLDDILSSGDLSFPYEATGEVAVVNPRLSAGVGIGLGPVVFDISAHYFVNTGLAFGANLVVRI